MTAQGTSVSLDPLEIATQVICGEAPSSDERDSVWHSATDPVVALENAIRPHLQAGPCCVAFSGGRDSSAILAVAVHLARREGLSVPMPVTLQVPTGHQADETAWQHRVLEHLKIDDWHQIETSGLLDALGPVGTGVLARQGLLWPANAYFMVPMLQISQGGSLLTGLDGDGLFAEWRWGHLADVRARRVARTGRDLVLDGYARAPAWLRAAIDRRRHPLIWPWLQPLAAKEVSARWFSEQAQEPSSWHRRIRWWARRRYLSVLQESLAVLADEAGAHIAHPFLNTEFLGALAARGMRVGLGGRTEVMHALFSAVLPPPVLQRSTKAVFDQEFWGERSRAFIADWDGTGLDIDIVDVVGLKEVWSREFPHAGSGMLLQFLWLQSRAADEIS